MSDRRGERFLDLVEVMDRLRSPGGCPWDAEQTHDSLVKYLVEETYETVESIDADDPVAMREELGDVLLQVVFHARIAQEDPTQPWDIDDVTEGIIEKLIARHPHVFGSESADTAEEVEATWHSRKVQEKGRTSALDGVPTAMPSLTQADKALGRVEAAGLDIPPADTVLTDGLNAALGHGPDREVRFGQAILALAALARRDGIDLDAAARAELRSYRKSVARYESHGRQLQN